MARPKSLPSIEELRKENKHLLDSEAIQEVVDATTPNIAEEMSNHDVLQFAEETAEEDAEFVKSVFPD